MSSSLVSRSISGEFAVAASLTEGSAGPSAEIRDGALQLPRIVATIQQHTRFLVTSHSRPDGDAIGSTLAMGSVLHALGKQVDMVLADPVPVVYRTLPGVQRVRQTLDIDQSKYDVAIVLECDGTARTGIRGLDGMANLLNIDHHLTGAAFGSLNWIDPSAAAVAAMVFEIAIALGATVTPAIATCLYTAVMTDTGSFTYPGTSADTFTLAHALIDLGAKADSVARDVLYSVPAARIHLLGLALSRVSIRGPIAWTWITQDDLEKLNATDEDSEGTVNYLISIAGVEAAAFLRELPRTSSDKSLFRTSLRSKSSVDVSLVAANCGGGGHRNAAGCTLQGPFDDAVAHILRELGAEVTRIARASGQHSVAVPSAAL
ncbi:exopolyphosphatase-like enzyme [Terriglobus roseus DSM 18391]|uniref:Exopolyphosphatase-like enzyme n=1 Tax=Terriglobus roseus (strain DSM 18391 / NRRL B-41598 / KBS 63) TaxID=926566 RepID=I3ZKE3_TERRK|nr:bifunctional oligoribonuclease/PAP phosphatase NrnA [Terriglobus roseus]AFL89711.1 exopolyphosphatase-like enzyme [Terriglobus roseus DSM 18391]